jgi:tRNA-dihydrouridine synthase A
MFKRSAINKIREKISIAPMVDVTDNYFRYFARFLTKHSFLYTEMINEHAIINIYQSGN